MWARVGAHDVAAHARANDHSSPVAIVDAVISHDTSRRKVEPVTRSNAGHVIDWRWTMADLNGAIIRKAYEDFAGGKISDVLGVFDAGITWHVPGHSPLSGDYTGHDQIGHFFQRTMELSGGAFSIDVHHVLTDGDHVVVLTTIHAQRNGTSASFPEVHVWRLKNGKAIEFREYQGDEQREDRFWS
jgi:ketosteroid isomerase-like protein